MLLDDDDDDDEEELPDKLENDFSDDGNRTALTVACMDLCSQNSFINMFVIIVWLCFHKI